MGIDFRVLTVQVVAILLAVYAWMLGYVQPLFNGDATGISYAVVAVAGAGTLSAHYRGEWLAWISHHGVCTMLGLLGTVLGFLDALAGLSEGSDVAKLAGVTTALTTTVVGMIAHLYLILLQKVRAS